MANIGISEADSKKIADILHKYLASEIVLNLKIRNFHWNVVGINFNDLHKFFEELYISGSWYADEVAERIRMLGLHTQASMKEYIEMTIIPEEKDIKMHSDMMIEQLLSNNETLITEMRKDIDIIGSFGDQGTEDFLTALIQKHEKDAWILRSLQAKG